jgi:uncharacterized membrane protein YgcG
MKKRILLLLASCLISLIVGSVFGNVGLTSVAAQDGRSLRWDRYDVTIDEIDTAANRFRVTETYLITVETGPFSFGFAEIPQGRLDRITGVEVFENRSPLRASCAGAAGTFCARDEGDTFTIQYYFTSPMRTGERREFTIRYTVYGALRSYEQGDQLYWVAVPGDLSFPVLASTVRVIMPADRPPQLVASYPDTWAQRVDGNTVTWQSPGRLPRGQAFEVRVQYEHDPAMKKPSWQAAYDRERAYKDKWQPLVSLLILALSALMSIGGVLFVVVRYQSRGRDPQALVVPEYLTDPPSEERPGIVGVLLDERADMKDIMATLLDLARRGYVVIEQEEKGGLAGMFGSSEFTFHRTGEISADLRPFEQSLLRGLFPGDRDKTTLSQLRNKFYKHIPTIKKQMYDELVQQGYFKRSPETTRALWTWGGVALIAVAAVTFWLSLAATLISPVIMCLPLSVGVIGLSMAIVGQFMPAKTVKGAQEAAQWRAFRRYLDNLENYGGVQEAAQKFELALPYAVAFGIQSELVRKLTPALTSMPGWYFPTYMGGPWQGGYRPGQPVRPWGPQSGGMGDFSLGGPGGLGDMNRSLTDGLNAMSKGLTQMLNDASRVLSSTPQSSGSGGFSGGGRGGGGGSGGGSRGFG